MDYEIEQAEKVLNEFVIKVKTISELLESIQNLRSNIEESAKQIELARAKIDSFFQENNQSQIAFQTDMQSIVTEGFNEINKAVHDFKSELENNQKVYLNSLDSSSQVIIESVHKSEVSFSEKAREKMTLIDSKLAALEISLDAYSKVIVQGFHQNEESFTNKTQQTLSLIESKFSSLQGYVETKFWLQQKHNKRTIVFLVFTIFLLLASLAFAIFF